MKKLFFTLQDSRRLEKTPQRVMIPNIVPSSVLTAQHCKLMRGPVEVM